MRSPKKSIAEMMDDLLLLTARALSGTHRLTCYLYFPPLPTQCPSLCPFFLLPFPFCLSYPLSFELISTHYSSAPTPSSPHLLFLSASLISSTAATRSTIFCSPFLSSASTNCLLLAALSSSIPFFFFPRCDVASFHALNHPSFDLIISSTLFVWSPF